MFAFIRLECSKRMKKCFECKVIVESTGIMEHVLFTDVQCSYTLQSLVNDPLSTESEVPRSHPPDPSDVAALGGVSDLDPGRLIVPFFTVWMYVHTIPVCIETMTSGVESASNPTKPRQRRGRAQKGSSDLFAGR